jgi:hypothetical protein
MRFKEPPVANARITSFSASSDVLISAPSIRVVRLAMDVSTPRSLPAKSMNVSRPMEGGTVASTASKLGQNANGSVKTTL